MLKEINKIGYRTNEFICPIVLVVYSKIFYYNKKNNDNMMIVKE